MTEREQADFAATPLNQVKRLAERGRYDKDSVYRIVDEALICHVGFVQDGQPFVLPTIHARLGDTLVRRRCTLCRAHRTNLAAARRPRPAAGRSARMRDVPEGLAALSYILL